MGRRKVYCANCQYCVESTEQCIIGYRDTPMRQESIFGDCNELNKKNDCKRFKWAEYPFL